MANGLADALRGIRKGAGAPGIPGRLSDQIRANRMQAQEQKATIEQGLQNLMMREKEHEFEVRKRAQQAAKEQREALLARRERYLGELRGKAEELSTMVQNDPARARRHLKKYPKIAEKLGIDPDTSSLTTDVLASRDRLFAQTEGKAAPDRASEEGGRPLTEEERREYQVPEGVGAQMTDDGVQLIEPAKRGQDERALAAPSGSPLYNAIGLEEGAEIKYVGDAPYVDESGEVVNAENITNFEELGVSKKQVSQIGGDKRAGGDLTMGDIVLGKPGDFPVPTGLDMAAGPLDTLISASTRIPGLNEFFSGLAKDPNFGEEQRIARRIGDELENKVMIAFKPSEDGRTSNLQIELARKLAPRLGVLSTDDSVQTDLEILHERTQAKAKKELAVANNNSYTEETRKKSEQRAKQLGDLLELTGPLLQASKDPRFPVANMLGKPIEKASGIELADVFVELSSNQQERLLGALTEREKKKLKEGLE